MEQSECKKCYGSGSPDAAEGAQQSRTKSLVMTALIAALAMVATMFFRIPTIATQGYIHLGDAVIYLGVMILGRERGAFAAGAGAGLADLLGGYPHWALFSFVIKAVCAYVFGTLEGSRLRTAAAYALSGAISVAGYYAASVLLYGSLTVPLASVPWNILQAAAGVAVAVSLSAILSRSTRQNNQ